MKSFKNLLLSPKRLDEALGCKFPKTDADIARQLLILWPFSEIICGQALDVIELAIKDFR
jgi:hypothetical protein